MLLIILGIFAGLFILLGIMFLNGKGPFLIAGHNAASKAEEEKIDQKKLCRFVGKLMFLFAGCFLILMSSDIFGEMWLLGLGLTLFFCISIGGIIHINTGKRFKKDSDKNRH